MSARRFKFIWLVGLLLPTVLWAQSGDTPTLTARFDRTTVFSGDSVVLRVTLSNLRTTAEPDFTTLERDFVIGETGTNSSMSIVNGRREFSTEWNVLLEPKRTGEIRVPALEIAGLSTRPLVLTVMERPDGTGPQGREVFIEVEATPDDPYVHGQVLFVIRLYHAPAIMEGSLGEPEAVDAVVERLGDDSDYRTQIQGQSYRVIERRYALFPERSGELSIPPIRFQGRVAEQSRQQGFNSLFSRGRLTSVKSDPVTLRVQPAPASFKGAQWLPAAELTVEEVWPNGEPQFRVGEPVTRTLMTRAKGLLSAQLPAIELPIPEGAKLYPDQPISQSRTDGTWVVGSREDKFAIVPTQAGTLTLPELRIPWWDTVNDRAAEVIIPARQYEVLPAPGQAAMPTTAPLVGEIELGPATGPVVTVAESGWWREVAAVATLLWLLTLVLYLRARRQPARLVDRSPGKSAPEPTPGPKPLKRACRANDPAAAAEAILAWVSAAHPNIRSLGKLAQHVDSEDLAAELRYLDGVLYSGRDEREHWRGERLWELCRGGIQFRHSAPPADVGPLPQLYARRA